MQLAYGIWGSATGTQPTEVDERGPLYQNSAKDHIAAKRIDENFEDPKPYSGKTVPSAELYGCVSGETCLDKWFADL